ncbi:TPA: hypothetical protein HA361_03900 [Candidatus Woesearchaeota archaeon]|nr:hypothetical protein [Candidatus Woesearchaeota archaeon]
MPHAKRPGHRATGFHAAVAFLFGIFLVTRLALLFTSQQHLAGDPASIAVMAMDTFKEGKLHYFIYGEPYIGGAAIESYLAVLTFLLFGISDISFKLVSVMVSCATFFLLYYFASRHFGKLTAVFALTLFTFSSPFMTRLSVMGLSGYPETLFFFLLMGIFTYDIFVKSKGTMLKAGLMGLTVGIAWWNLEYALAYLLFFVFIWYLSDKRFYTRKTFRVFVLLLLVSISPLIYYNATHNFSNIKHFMAGNAIHRFACEHNLLPGQMAYGDRIIDPCHIFEKNLRNQFSITSFFTVTLHLLFNSWTYYFLALLLFGLISILNLRYFLPFISSLNPFSESAIAFPTARKELILVLFVYFWAMIFMLSGWTDVKHFSPVFPFFILLISYAIALIVQHSRQGVFLGMGILILLLIGTVPPLAQSYAEKDKESIAGVIDFLENNSIHSVYSSHPLKWKILFYTQKKVIASCDLCPCPNWYGPIESLMTNDEHTAYIFDPYTMHIADGLEKFMANNSISYGVATIQGNRILYNLSEPINAKEILAPCNWLPGIY